MADSHRRYTGDNGSIGFGLFSPIKTVAKDLKEAVETAKEADEAGRELTETLRESRNTVDEIMKRRKL